MGLDAFRRAMEDGEPEAILATLAEDVVLHSPVTARPFHGRELVGGLLAAARATLEGLTYVHELAGDDLHALTFTAAVGDRAASGVDLVVLDDEGRVRDFTATIRPLAAVQAFNAAMGERVAPLLAVERARADGARAEPTPRHERAVGDSARAPLTVPATDHAER